MTATSYFLTGGSGYIGRNLIRSLTAQGHRVVALARSDDSAARIEALGAQVFRGDLLADNLADGMAGCQVVIHAAADTDHNNQSRSQYQTNVDGTLNVLNSARRAGIKKALYISTESVLLDGQPLHQVSEDHPLPRRAIGEYSRSKAAAEKIALNCADDDFTVVVVRPRFVWGRDDTTALPQLVDAAKSGQLAWIDGGHYLTSTTHILNLCAGISSALEHGKNGEVYFITDAEPVEFRQFATELLATQGMTAPDKSVPLWLLKILAWGGDMISRLSGGRLRGPVTRQSLATSAVEVTIDISKAKAELNYQPVVSRAEGLAELEHHSW
ncbi:NAD-dependent epimerase/dehydratase family protein [Natronospirillum operosum]|uniref:NAD-dependent epimerase/dehydratase family protein n=1 Tax=Natronospirillum operosum TaxID=2759953 RepID=A0A4Z0WB20_9GAMM|nr:NAD-dependent epimerase/dehydratase family protein [Natronospirillum operosum]TGG91736.1 NAD-dependent epimerase/dehydratase family protein [Natronospirillum operosum]